MSVPTSVRLSDETDARLRALAQRTGRSVTSLITEAVEAQLEDLEDAQCAVEAYMEHRRSGEPFLIEDQVFGDLDD